MVGAAVSVSEVDGRTFFWSDDAAVAAERRVIPAAVVPIVIDLGGGDWSVLRDEEQDGPFSSFIVGIHGTHGRLAIPAGPSCVQLHLLPTQAFQLLGHPLDAIAGSASDLGSILDLPGRRHIEKIRSVPVGMVVPELRKFIRRQLEVNRPACSRVGWAAGRISSSGGRIPISEIAESVGWSRKHLWSRFKQQVGASPEAFRRLVRFQQTARETRSGFLPDARMAVRLGYSDQAHLCREFRTFSGLSPGDYVKSLR